MKTFAILAAILVAAGSVGWYVASRPEGPVQYRTAKVARGPLLMTVNATGTVQPLTQVQVGTQVTGTVLKLFADFNSKVKADQVVAQIDPATYQAKVAQDQANLLKSQADVERVRANLTVAGKELERAKDLHQKGILSVSELDAAVATFDARTAELKVAEAGVIQVKAVLDSSIVNLAYTTIKSPIDGVVISRNVDVGQTVAASLSAPTLFVVADNLKRMLIQSSVPEADIGRIAENQDVSFTVDAYRETKFQGKVAQIRLAPTTVQNVVTYTVIIYADNPDEKLLPGMTASVTFEVAKHDDALKIPNAALRFIPPSAVSAPEPGGHGGGRGPKMGSRIWMLGADGPVATYVVTGATDGSFTQIVKGEIQEGQEVILGISQEGSKEPQVSNPFVPSRPRGHGGGR